MAERTARVLIVDDTPENLKVLGEILAAEGLDVRVAISGLQGFEIARTGGIDLILLDVMMPDLNGYEVCTRLKAHPATRDIPILFLTALDSTDDQAKGLGLGAVDYITKPFKVELVRTRIQNQLALYQARKELKRHNEELDQLVAERSRELAEAHRHLKAVDAAKYDFLQLIYGRLWGAEGLVPLSSQAWGLIDPDHPDRAALMARYDVGQKELFETMRNALKMTASGGPGPALATVDVLWSRVRERVHALAESRQVKIFDAALDQASPARLAGEVDLLVQALTVLSKAAVLLAEVGASVTVSREAQPGLVQIVWTGVGPGADETLFQPDQGLHPSEVGKALGFDLPLAVRILTALGGTVEFEPAEGRWTLVVGLRTSQFR